MHIYPWHIDPNPLLQVTLDFGFLEKVILAFKSEVIVKYFWF